MDFVSIDFETANSCRSSACSLGIAVVKRNIVVEAKHWLIRPEPFFFDPYNIAVHGITEDDVSTAPTFADIWDEVGPLLKDQIIVAHNASFDFSVLMNTLYEYKRDLPDIKIICTYRLAQRVFPHMGCYRLNVVCRAMNIPLIHHNAESDAIACATFLSQQLTSSGVETTDEFEKHFGLTLGFWKNAVGFYEDNYAPCRSKYALPVPDKRTAKDFQGIKPIHIDDDFNGRYFVFTGTLLSMPRSKAMEVVALGGGIPQRGVTKETNCLVVGIQDIEKTNGGSSDKMRKAYALKEKGQDIQIVAEDDFLSMIDNELYQKCFHSNIKMTGGSGYANEL